MEDIKDYIFLTFNGITKIVSNKIYMNSNNNELS